jgi:transposase
MSECNESTQAAIWSEAAGAERSAEPPREPVAKPPARFQAINRQQLVFRAVDVEQLLEPDHLARAIWEMTGRLDLSAYATEVRAVEGRAGRSAIDPHLLISLWVYAYSEGVSRAREIERRCAYPPAYQWLTGCEVINYHTLSDFRVEHQQALDGLFAQLLAILSSEGLITLEQVVHDGTKVKAAASSQSFHRETTLRQHLAAAQERVRAMGDPREEDRERRTQVARQRAAREKVERLEQALEELKKVQAAPEGRADPAERRASETDPEARNMRQSDGGSAPSHNVQISTDAAHAIIVGASVTQEANDQQQLLPAVEEVKRQNGRAPEQMIVDDGYTTRENVLAAADQQAWELIGTGNVGAGAAEATGRRLEKRGVAPDFHPQNFAFDVARNTYTCPAGKTLPYRYTKHDRVGVNRKAYRARAADCRACAFHQQCCPGAPSRTLVHTENVPAVAAYIARMQTEAARGTYRLRAPLAEFTNAWLKAKLGLRQFCVRGLQKVRCEVLWACLTYNIQQWFRLRWKVRLAAAVA